MESSFGLFIHTALQARSRYFCNGLFHCGKEGKCATSVEKIVGSV